MTRFLSVFLVALLTSTSAFAVDGDGDGFDPAGVGVQKDCDDTDPDRAPNLPEVAGDGKDNDCDGEVDEAGAVAVTPPEPVTDINDGARCLVHHCPNLDQRKEEKRRCEAAGGKYYKGLLDYRPAPGKKDVNEDLYGWGCFDLPGDLEWINCMTGDTEPDPFSRDAGRPDGTFEAISQPDVRNIEDLHGKVACDHLVPRGKVGGSGASHGYVNRGDEATLATSKAYTDEQVKAEAEARVGADNYLLAQLAAEETARTTADEALGDRIDGVEGRVDDLEDTVDTHRGAIASIARRPYPVFRFGVGVPVLFQSQYVAGDNLLRGGVGYGGLVEMAGGAVVANGRLEVVGVVQYARVSEQVSSPDGQDTGGRGGNVMTLGPELTWWFSDRVGFGGHGEGFFHGSAAIPAFGNGVESWGGTFGPVLAVRLTDESADAHSELGFSGDVGFESAGAVIEGQPDVHSGAVGGLSAVLSVVF